MVNVVPRPATLRADPTLVLPPAIRAQAERSVQLHAAMRDPQIDEDGNPIPVTPEGNLAEVTSESNEPAVVETAQEAAKEPAPAEPAAEPDKDSWEHKYKSLHGRTQHMKNQIDQLVEDNKALRATLATMAKPQASLEDLTASTITDEETADYGEDFLRLIGKKAREEVAPVLNAYKAEIESLKATVNQQNSASSADRLLSGLDAQLPNWRELNTNPEFLEWLSLPDTYSGAIRHDMLKAAYTAGNAPRVLAFFNGFLAEEAAVAPAKAEPEIGRTVVPKVPLANLAAPGRAKTAASQSGPAEKPIITRAQISAFYADIAAGVYRDRDAEKLAGEDMIFSAQKDGRIR